MTGSYFADIATQVLFLVILANSLNLLLGVAGQMSMATAAFYGVGAYTCAIMTATGITYGGSEAVGPGWPFWGGFLSAVVVSVFAGFLVALPAARRVRGDYLILLTLAFQFLFSTSANTFVSLTGGPNGMAMPPMAIGDFSIDTTDQALVFFAVVAVLSALFCSFVARSPFGRLLRGIREDEGVVRALGKTTVLPKSLAFALAAGIAGGIGALAASYMQFVAPATYNLDFAVLVAACVALGGPGNILGSTVAAIVIGSIRPVLQNLGMTSTAAIPWESVIFGLLLVLGIRFRPKGFLPENMRWFGGRTPAAAPESHDMPVSSGKKQKLSKIVPENRKPVVEARNLSKRYGGLQAVEDFSIDLYKGEIVALIGPNGAGKTTIFNLLMDNQRSDTGTIKLNGNSIFGLGTATIAKTGMVRYFQGVRAFGNMTALDNVALAMPHQPGEKLLRLLTNPLAACAKEKEVRAKAMELLDFVGIGHLANSIVQDLPFGQQKLVAFARLIATGAEVLLLDEPASGVDPRAAEQIIALVQQLAANGKTICIVEHSLHIVSELADRVVFMNAGKVVADGSIDDVTSRPDLVDLYFGT
ncbi:ATP-binding cassette domain-containing protein [Rhizobium lusitanum]|uniref:ATP-binding cassette domain-containing protein n=1 Tax=Rhizobium lusitanum TaxID=293958 RepID=A0A6L9UIH2_9HYPH|nr:branched-chain amino acid ABC transporter ATP-binding protein/permease [Rhizobium lusitanum]NEI73670.1 ATP-binding cassette domain-containing protein [Rhizobium lusitanum]